MILYFSATGNSEYLANKLGNELNENVIDLFSLIKEGRSQTFLSESPFVLVNPTYSWRVPRFISEYLLNCDFEGSRDFYLVINYGDSCGNAYKYIKDDAEKLGLNFKGLYGLKMPENYLMLFDLESDEVNQDIINQASRYIGEIATYIRNKKDFPKEKVGFAGRFQSKVINPIFFKYIARDNKFYATDKCISCGLCEKVCVLNNISYRDGKPIWKGNCTHCSACISKCPELAIEYGKKTQGKDRYLLKNVLDLK
ncbi:EFR1 family ferrodoxin [uncultured Anaerococcus sp.]|uniref:EFR1 family ferrodoxin n=1 Tax=uncultured Anaerococcus sp. TaxID=293428 RepID=UPI0025F41034|nr:EFR1 family ferrodoxin [uncultured Anaerococcus sp.]